MSGLAAFALAVLAIEALVIYRISTFRPWMLHIGW